MPRNGSGIYNLPDGFEAVTGETILATQHNAPLEDIQTDLNAARPIVAGGTGATTADGALTALGGGAFGISVFKSASSPTALLKTLDNKAAVAADTVLSYSGTGAAVAGDFITTRQEGNVYVVAASAATDHHLTTAGGVKLYDFGDNASQAVGHTQLVMDRLERDENADIIVLTDSTGDTTAEWPYLLAALIGAAYPTHTVLWRLWNTGTTNYDSATTIQTGSGSGTLTFWVGAISGSIANRLVGPALLNAVTPGTIGGDPDLVIIAYGHNGGNEIERHVPMEAAAIGTVQRLCPFTPIIIVGPNPVRSGSDTEDGSMRAKIEAFQMVAQKTGAGFINVHGFYLDYARPLVNYYATSDTIHPNALGSALWAYCMWRAFQYRPQAAIGSTLSVLDRGIIYAKDSYADLSGWTASDVSVASQATFETSGASMKVTGNGVAAFGWITKTIISSSDIIAYRGRYVTFNARVYVPASSNIGCGRVALYDGTTTVVQSPDGGPQGAGWTHIAVSIKVGYAATSLAAYIYANQGGASTNYFYVDRVTVSDGPIPRDAIPTLAANDMSAIASTTTNGNGTAVIFTSGLQICYKSFSVTTAVSTAWGSLYRSGDQTASSWAVNFGSIGYSDVRSVSGSPPLGVVPYGAPSTSSGPGFWLWSPTSVASASFSLVAFGVGIKA